MTRLFGGSRGLALAALIIGITASADAQSARVQGQVVDSTGGAVAGAWVTVSQAPAPVVRAVSDGTGRFVITGLAPGVVELVVERPPFAPTRLRVSAGEGTRGALRVVLEVDQIRESVTVASPVIDANPVDAFGGVSTTVSDAQVRDLNALDLASALRRTPGVTISRFNPVGAFGGTEGGAVYVRGMGASRPGSEIKAYVDGVPFYMGVWGHPLLDLLPVNAIDRITVVKGPQPQQYGNTFSAIDLSTRRARSDGIEGNLRLTGGAFSTLVEQADLTGRMGRWDFTLAQGLARSAGHRDDADGRLANVLGRAGFQFNEAWSVSGTAMYLNNTASDPGVLDQPATRAGQYNTTGLLGTLALQHRHRHVEGLVQVYANQGDGNWLNQTALDGDTLTSFGLAGLRWREQVRAWPGGRVSVGLDIDRVGGDVFFNRVAPAPTAAFDGTTMSITSPHLAVDHALALAQGWTAVPSAGVRFYRHSELASETAPHAGLVIRHASGLALRTTYARGVSYPGQDVAVLASLIPPLGQSWRTLAPERLEHVEAGASLSPRQGTTVDVAYFHDRLRDRYVFAFPPAVAFPQFTNLGRYAVRGLEASVQHRIVSTWNLFAGLTVLDPTLETLPYAPDRTVQLGVTGGHGPWRLSADAQYQSAMTVFGAERAFGAANTQQVDGFLVVNLRPAYALPNLAGRGELFVAVENLFNASYEYRPGYPMPGTSLQVGVTLGRKFR